MSQARASQTPAPDWMSTLIHAAVGLFLFITLTTGALLYGFLVLKPQLLEADKNVVYDRTHTLVPNLLDPTMPVWLTLWAATVVLVAAALAVVAFVMIVVYRQPLSRLWIWGGAAATLALLIPPLVMMFTLPSVPKIAGGDRWWFITGAGLAVCLVYVGWMYFRDGRGVGPLWAVLLGLLRASVLTLLAFFFMLPAVQPYHKVYSRSKVLLLFDVSNSMPQITDDVPDENHPAGTLLTRQDKVLAFLADHQIDFLHRLQAKNPLDVYRFARSTDPEYLHFTKDNRNWTPEELTTWLNDSKRDQSLKDPSQDPKAFPSGDLPQQFWQTWLKPGAPIQADDTWTGDQKVRFDRFFQLGDALAGDHDYLKKTNFIDSLNILLKTEGNKTTDENSNDLQAVILFSDGHNTPGEPSPDAFEKAKNTAKKLHVPIFVVGVGKERSQVKLEITELRVPPQIQPDDKFPAVVELTGDGLSGEPAPVELEVVYVRKVYVKEGDKDVVKEEELPIILNESVDLKPDQKVLSVTKGLPPGTVVVVDGKVVDGTQAPPTVHSLCETQTISGQKRTVLVRNLVEAQLPSRIVLRPADPVKFDTGSPPRAEVEFPIDAAKLAAAAGVDLAKQYDKVGKWEIAATAPDAELRFRAHVPTPAKEVIAAKEHVSDPAGMVVREKPLRVLLLASAATHDYQFLQAILVRDMSKGSVKVFTFLQPPPGQQNVQAGVIQDATLLDHFPDKFDPPAPGQADKADNPDDLSEYDVIVAFDPDWKQFSKEQLERLFGKDDTGDDGKPRHVPGWVDKGGGFIYVAGPVNTVQLAEPGDAEKTRLGQVLKDLPVVPKDVRLVSPKRETDKAWPLDFKDASAETLKLLKLRDETPDDKFQDDWKDFFGPLQPDKSVNRGFYNFYPVESAVPGSVVAAFFGDPESKAKDPTGQTSLMPYLVVSNPADLDKRVIWLGWGEMWRLRQKNEAYLERFWTKLTRYAGDLHHGKISKRITPNFGKVFKSTDVINMEARIEGQGGEPLPEDAKPVVKIALTSPVKAIFTDDDRKLMLALQEKGGVSLSQLQRKAELEHLKKLKQITPDQTVELQQLNLQQLNGLGVQEKLTLKDLVNTSLAQERQDKEMAALKNELVMKAKPQTEREGWFQVQFKAPVPGEYTMDLTVPETGDTMTHHFTVKESNPEVDDARPDFDRLYEAASDAEQYLPARMTADEYTDLIQRLERPKLEENQQDYKPRLYFTLANAELIPQCLQEIEHNDVHVDDSEYIWGRFVSAPVGDRWMPWWVAWPLGVCLLLGCLAGSLLPLLQRPTGGRESQHPPWYFLVIVGCFGLVSLLGYLFTREARYVGWIVCSLVAVLLIVPVYLPPALIQLSWYPFTALIAVMSMEWLIRKLLRLA